MCHHYESTPEWETLVAQELAGDDDEEETGIEPEHLAPPADD